MQCTCLLPPPLFKSGSAFALALALVVQTMDPLWHILSLAKLMKLPRVVQFVGPTGASSVDDRATCMLSALNLVRVFHDELVRWDWRRVHLSRLDSSRHRRRCRLHRHHHHGRSSKIGSTRRRVSSTCYCGGCRSNGGRSKSRNICHSRSISEMLFGKWEIHDTRTGSRRNNTNDRSGRWY